MLYWNRQLSQQQQTPSFSLILHREVCLSWCVCFSSCYVLLRYVPLCYAMLCYVRLWRVRSHVFCCVCCVGHVTSHLALKCIHYLIWGDTMIHRPSLHERTWYRVRVDWIVCDFRKPYIAVCDVLSGYVSVSEMRLVWVLLHCIVLFYFVVLSSPILTYSVYQN